MSYRVIFMGTPEFSVPILEALVQNEAFEVVLVISQPNRPQGRKRELLPTPVAKKAMELGLDLWQPEKVRDLAFLDRIRACHADFIVTAAYGRILTSMVLAAPKYGPVNVHASLLPKYRGASPVHWSIINGDPTTGVSIMLMDDEMDHGDILLKEEIEIPEYITTDLLSERLSLLGASVISDALIAYAEGKIKPTPQAHEDASYVKLLKREDGLIDFDRSALDIHNLVRGTYPWPGAYTFWHGKRFKVHKAQVESYPKDEWTKGVPGEVVYVDGDGIRVSCGEGYITFIEVQAEGSRRMHADEIGHNIELGTIFGQSELER